MVPAISKQYRDKFNLIIAIQTTLKCLAKPQITRETTEKEALIIFK